MPEPVLIDLTQPVRTGMPVFPNDPEVVFEAAPALPPWRVTRLSLGTHSGTHIDAASHFLPKGATIDEYPLERFVMTAHVVRVEAAAGGAIPWAVLDAALLSLHGHIHESRGQASIGRTVAVNPGSEYGEGVLRGAIVTLAGDTIENVQQTSG
jgi:kynurenine formamidase